MTSSSNPADTPSGANSPLKRAKMRRGANVFEDLFFAFKLHQLWRTLAWRDLFHRFSRSYLGVAWIIISFAAMAATLYLIFGHRLDPAERIEYVTYLTTGLVIWNFISNNLTKGVSMFSSDARWVKGSSAPFSVLPLKLLTFNSMDAALSSLMAIPFVVLFAQMTDPILFAYAAGGVLIIALNSFLVSLLFGSIGAWSSDFQHLVPAVMRMAFFATPVFWRIGERGGVRHILATYNPFTHFLALVREPLMGHPPTCLNWIVTLSVTGVVIVVSLASFAYARPRLATWI